MTAIREIIRTFTTNTTNTVSIPFSTNILGDTLSFPLALNFEFTLSWARASGSGSQIGICKYLAIWQLVLTTTVSTSTPLKGVGLIGSVGTPVPTVFVGSASTPSIEIIPPYNYFTNWVMKGDLWLAV